jgi:hypothetical protein
MSEATGRVNMERRLVERSLQDEDFRQRLLSDPKGAIEEELETRLPPEVRVQAVEESAETIYLVLPPAPSRANEQGKSSSPTGSWRAWLGARARGTNGLPDGAPARRPYASPNQRDATRLTCEPRGGPQTMAQSSFRDLKKHVPRGRWPTGNAFTCSPPTAQAHNPPLQP